MQSNSLNMNEQKNVRIFISIYFSSSFLKFYPMVDHNVHKVLLNVYYITDVYSYTTYTRIYIKCISHLFIMFTTFYMYHKDVCSKTFYSEEYITKKVGRSVVEIATGKNSQEH